MHQKLIRNEVLRSQQLTSSWENRVASESNDQRAARLQHQRQSQSDKIGSETEQERAARLQCDAEQHRVAANNLSTSSRSTSDTKENSEISCRFRNNESSSALCNM